jgi:malonyl CoA-acyl carrier protein transacylase
MNIYMFPGQGAQTKGMGSELFERFPERVAQADAVLGYSIRELCVDDPREELGQTQFTQPALYVVNALSYFARIEDDGGREPDVVLGHSLGEFDALMAAGCFDFETGLRLVQKRGALMSQVSGGAMAAVLNASRDDIEQALREGGLHNVHLANYNSPSQIVISGLREELERAEPLLRKGRTRFYPLATSGAFHTVFMREAMEQFRAFLASVTLSAPRIPVIANVTARPYRSEAILDTLANQIASTVRWSESVQYLLARAARSGQTPEFVELGPGDVLTRLVMTIRSQTPDDVLQSLRIQIESEQIEGEAIEGHATEGNEMAISMTASVSPAPAAVETLALSTSTEQKPVEKNSAEQKVAAWNARHPIGARVRSLLAGYGDLRTRTEAVVLFGHRPAVYMQGYNGYFDLDELR